MQTVQLNQSLYNIDKEKSTVLDMCQTIASENKVRPPDSSSKSIKAFLVKYTDLTADKIRIGKTKVFLKSLADYAELISASQSQQSWAAMKIQRWWKVIYADKIRQLESERLNQEENQIDRTDEEGDSYIDSESDYESNENEIDSLDIEQHGIDFKQAEIYKQQIKAMKEKKATVKQHQSFEEVFTANDDETSITDSEQTDATAPDTTNSTDDNFGGLDVDMSGLASQELIMDPLEDEGSDQEKKQADRPSLNTPVNAMLITPEKSRMNTPAPKSEHNSRSRTPDILDQKGINEIKAELDLIEKSSDRPDLIISHDSIKERILELENYEIPNITSKSENQCLSQISHVDKTPPIPNKTGVYAPSQVTPSIEQIIRGNSSQNTSLLRVGLIHSKLKS